MFLKKAKQGYFQIFFFNKFCSIKGLGYWEPIISNPRLFLTRSYLTRSYLTLSFLTRPLKICLFLDLFVILKIPKRSIPTLLCTPNIFIQPNMKLTFYAHQIFLYWNKHFLLIRLEIIGLDLVRNDRVRNDSKPNWCHNMKFSIYSFRYCMQWLQTLP